MGILRLLRLVAGTLLALLALLLGPALLAAQQPTCPPPPTEQSIAAAAQQMAAREAAGRGRSFGPGRGVVGRGRGHTGRPQRDPAAGMVLHPCLDELPPQLPANYQSGGVLIFSKTNGFREEAAIEASNVALSVIAAEHGWPYFVTEDGAVMNPSQLRKFKLVIWNNNSGDVLTTAQRAAFKSWVENGGTYIGIHGAGGDPVTAHPPNTTLAAWPWYIHTLLGAQFTSHAPFQPGTVVFQDTASPITKGLPRRWHHTDEWYAFATNPAQAPGFHVLATADESTYYPGRSSMGADHPLVWWHCVGQGHMLFSAIGHAGLEYSDPVMIHLLDNAMSWGVNVSGHGCSQ